MQNKKKKKQTEERGKNLIKYVINLQKNIRMFLARLKYKRIIKKIVLTQKGEFFCLHT